MDEADKFRLIEAVRERPLLWDCRIPPKQRSKVKCNRLWSEVAYKLNTDVATCTKMWKRLRGQFCNEANRIPIRIRRAKRKGVYNPKMKYYTWCYFDALRFVVTGLSLQAQFKSTFGNESNIGIEEQNDINPDHVQILNKFKDITFSTESDTELEIVESIASDQTQSETDKYLENQGDSDNDVELIEDNSSNPVQLQSDGYFQSSSLANTSNNTCATFPAENSEDFKKEDAYFKSYTISLCEVAAGSEFTAVSSDNDVLHNDSALRQELEFHFSATKNDVMQVHRSSDCTPKSTSCDDQAVGSPDASDQDYSFLYSFLSQTKLMTCEQKATFQGNMKSLLYIFPAFSAANILEKQLQLPECEDPDLRFLLSFWPFMKSMTLLQNIQFRLKVTELIFNILFTESNSFSLPITNSV